MIKSPLQEKLTVICDSLTKGLLITGYLTTSLSEQPKASEAARTTDNASSTVFSFTDANGDRVVFYSSQEAEFLTGLKELLPDSVNQ